MTEYKKLYVDGNSYIEIPETDPQTGALLYRRRLDNEIYPKIYKDDTYWAEYCLHDGKSERYYAKRDDEEYYPTDSNNRKHIIRKFIDHPVFTKNSSSSTTITFVHLDWIHNPFNDVAQASFVRDFKKVIRFPTVFTTLPDLSVGRHYIKVMTTPTHESYDSWRKIGLTEEQFKRN
jgi:hypothetical protein